jgi:hypothetical protein
VVTALGEGDEGIETGLDDDEVKEIDRCPFDRK